MDFNEYIQECVTYLRFHPEQRWGQACFNVLECVRPEIADMVRGTRYDPFYADMGGDIRPFWRTIRAAW